MNAVRLAIILASIGLVLCLWLLVRVNWYNFIAFMLIAQPLLVLAVIVFAVALLRELRKQGVL